jgi:hypothetical protein
MCGLWKNSLVTIIRDYASFRSARMFWELIPLFRVGLFVPWSIYQPHPVCTYVRELISHCRALFLWRGQQFLMHYARRYLFLLSLFRRPRTVSSGVGTCYGYAVLATSCQCSVPYIDFPFARTRLACSQSVARRQSFQPSFIGSCIC